MDISRRAAIGTGLALATAPGILRAQQRPSSARTIRAIIQGDISTYDPIWTTANTSAYHGAMVYDTLFGLDENYNSKPQMVGDFGVSDDKLTWTFALREGLKFTDGTPVTTADVIPSIKRWAVRSGSGQLLMQRVASLDAKDDKTFVFKLKEPFPLIIDILGNTTTPLLFIMRKKEAETDPMQKIDTILGSGPFIFNQQRTRPGNQYVYDKNPNDVPRADPASGIAGLQRGRGGLAVGHGHQDDPVDLDDLAAGNAARRVGAGHVIWVLVVDVLIAGPRLLLVEDERAGAEDRVDLLHRVGLGFFLAHDEQQRGRGVAEDVDDEREGLLQLEDESLVVLGVQRSTRCISNWPEPERTAQRLMLGITSAVVTGVPSVNFSPSRRAKVQVSLSSETPKSPTICGLEL